MQGRFWLPQLEITGVFTVALTLMLPPAFLQKVGWWLPSLPSTKAGVHETRIFEAWPRLRRASSPHGKTGEAESDRHHESGSWARMNLLVDETLLLMSSIS